MGHWKGRLFAALGLKWLDSVVLTTEYISRTIDKDKRREIDWGIIRGQGRHNGDSVEWQRGWSETPR